MLKHLLFLLASFATVLQTGAQSSTPRGGAFFIENKGQWPQQVLFLARLSGMDAWITRQGVTYDFYRPDNGLRRGEVVQVQVGGQPEAVQASGQLPLEGKFNYFIGSNRAVSATRYEEALVAGVLPGTAVRWYFEGNSLRYDFVVQPNAELARISMRMSANTKTGIDAAGDLTFSTRFGPVKQSKLYAYQHINGRKEQVPCRFVKRADGSIGFDVQRRDPNAVLVIDPLIYSTFFGSPGNEDCQAIDVDQFGQVYITGSEVSATFPTTPGAYDNSQNGDRDGYVMKLSAGGGNLIYCTFLGGSGTDYPTAIAVDASGSSYITGRTTSPNFPTSSNAFDNSYNSGTDAFVTRLNTGGDALDYSTYLGGTAADEGQAIAVNAQGQVLVAGITASSGFPVAGGGYGGGASDGFVLRLNATGSAVLNSRFIGGATADAVNGLAVDPAGNVYLGGTTGGGIVTTAGAFNTTYNGGQSDLFLMKLNPALSTVTYATYFGGNGDEDGGLVALSPGGFLCFAGASSSANLPVSGGAIVGAYSGGGKDGFVARLEPDGSALTACTYYGAKTIIRDIVADGAGNMYITGSTNDAGLPVTGGSVAQSYLGGNEDGFVGKLDVSASVLMYGTFLGGSNAGLEGGTGLYYDRQGTVYVCGTTHSADFPTTAGAYRNVIQGDADAFVAKLNLFACPAPSAAAFSNAPLCTGDTLTLSATSLNAAGYEWTGPQDFYSLVSTSQVNTVTAANAGVYTVAATDLNGCTSTDTVQVRVRQRPSPVVVYAGDSLKTSLPYGAYQWYHNGIAIPSGGQFRTYSLPPNGGANGTYFVVVTDTNGCAASSQLVTVSGLAVGHLSSLAAQLHPNPTTGVLHFGLHQPVDASLRDVQGRLVMKAASVQQLDLRALQAGVYLLSLRDPGSGKTFTGKVIKK